MILLLRMRRQKLQWGAKAMQCKLSESFSSILLLIALATPASAKQLKYQMSCDLGKDTTQMRRANGSTVTLTFSKGMCNVSVLSPSGASIFNYSASDMQVFVGVGLMTDGNPDAVIQADTFNPYKLFIISLGEHPRLIKTIQNQYGFWLRDDCGGIRIWTWDGEFQGAPDLADVYHNDLFVPDVVLGLQGNSLVDATPKCRAYFDEEIKGLESQLSRSEIARFRSNRISDEFRRGEIKGYILKIVFCYLYTGQVKKAKQSLAEMWPPSDKERIWSTILKLRSEGVLRQAGEKQPER